MDMGLAGLTALVTGAGGGIGAAVAEAFAAEGANVVLHARSSYRGLAERLASCAWRDRALALPGDVTRPDEMDDVFDRATARFGRVDAVVANAGIWPPEDVTLERMPEDRLRRTIEVNLLGSIWTARSFLRLLARLGPRADGAGPSLTFVGSTAGRFGERGHVDYAVSKAGLHGLVRTLKNEIVALDPYGRVNMVEPGWTVTAMARPALAAPGTIARVLRTSPLRQLSRPEDIARAIVVLASPAASRNITGEVITVAGGMEGRVRWDAGEIDEPAVVRRLSE
jgi:3-oxoacyl-[acyl-carrier protein] reductase